jgi:hypothetical protein
MAQNRYLVAAIELDRTVSDSDEMLESSSGVDAVLSVHGSSRIEQVDGGRTWVRCTPVTTRARKRATENRETTCE